MVGSSALFSVGELIHHRLFGYRGVIFDVDPDFRGTEDWYAQMARSRPPRDEAWYHVLVHNAAHTTYVAEQNLVTDPTPKNIRHPLVNEFFSGFDGRRYISRQRPN